MRKLLVGTITAALLLVGCSDPEVEEEPVVDPNEQQQRIERLEEREQKLEQREQELEEFEFGSCEEAEEMDSTPLYKGDPGYNDSLDADGDGVACEGKLEPKPLPTPEPAPEISDEELVGELSLQLGWDTLTATEKLDACEGFNTLGAEIMYDFFMDSWGSEEELSAPSFEAFNNFFAKTCSQ